MLSISIKDVISRRISRVGVDKQFLKIQIDGNRVGIGIGCEIGAGHIDEDTKGLRRSRAGSRYAVADVGRCRSVAPDGAAAAS